MTIKITLNQIKEHNTCKDGWQNLLKSLGKTRADDTEITFSYIAETNDVSDALWCLWVLGEKYLKERCYLMADIADSVSYLYTKDNKVEECIKAIRDYGDSKIDVDILQCYRDAAVYTTHTVTYAAAVYAAYAAYYAADANTAGVAAVYTAHAADAAAYAANAAHAAERKKQIELIKKYLG